MVGVLLVSHGKIGQSFVEVAQQILGGTEQVKAISIGSDLTEDRIFHEIERARKDLEQGEGVLILTDMFGGSPSNICFSFLEESRVEVLTGLNLAMLIKILSTRKGATLEELARLAKECGRENICLGREILNRGTPESGVKGRH